MSRVDGFMLLVILAGSASSRLDADNQAADGTIEVYFDDMRTPVMKAEDKTFAWGRIGVGSFDDTSDWDDIKLHGTKVQPPGKARQSIQ